MICFSVLTVGNLHCLPVCPSITQSITRSYTGVWGSIYQSKHDTKTPPQSSRHLFRPSCPGAWSLPSPLLQSLWWLRSSHPRGCLEIVLFPWIYQRHVANFLCFFSALTTSGHSAQKPKDYTLLNLEALNCSLDPWELSFVRGHSSPIIGVFNAEKSSWHKLQDNFDWWSVTSFNLQHTQGQEHCKWQSIAQIKIVRRKTL